MHSSQLLDYDDGIINGEGESFPSAQRAMQASGEECRPGSSDFLRWLVCGCAVAADRTVVVVLSAPDAVASGTVDGWRKLGRHKLFHSHTFLRLVSTLEGGENWNFSFTPSLLPQAPAALRSSSS